MGSTTQRRTDVGVEKIASLMKRPRFKAVKALPGFRLRMTFIDGSHATVDFSKFFAESPGLAPLRDEARFAEACIGEDCSWTVEWPELDIQIGADTLWLDAQAQNAPMKTLAFLRSGAPRTG